MKINSKILFTCFAFMACGNLLAQKPDAQNPVIKNFGGIYPISSATILPDPGLTYNIAIEVKTGVDSKELNPSLINIARLINLHVLGGVKKENLHVVAIVHGAATTSIMNDASYNERFGVKNPNTELIKELEAAGVKIIICGQSMLARNVADQDLAEGINVSISMLTAFTTYQLKGYAALQF